MSEYFQIRFVIDFKRNHILMSNIRHPLFTISHLDMFLYMFTKEERLLNRLSMEHSFLYLLPQDPSLEATSNIHKKITSK